MDSGVIYSSAISTASGGMWMSILGVDFILFKFNSTQEDLLVFEALSSHFRQFRLTPQALISSGRNVLY